MVLGNFNGHHPSWFSRTGNDMAAAKWEALDGAVNSSQLAVANQDLSTRSHESMASPTPHLTALPGSEDTRAAHSPVHRGGAGHSPFPARLQTKALHRLGPAPISARVVSGFNQRKPPSRTIAIAVGISKAFDKVSHRLHRDDPPLPIQRWGAKPCSPSLLGCSLALTNVSPLAEP